MQFYPSKDLLYFPYIMSDLTNSFLQNHSGKEQKSNNFFFLQEFKMLNKSKETQYMYRVNCASMIFFFWKYFAVTLSECSIYQLIQNQLYWTVFCTCKKYSIYISYILTCIIKQVLKNSSFVMGSDTGTCNYSKKLHKINNIIWNHV